MPEWLDHLFKAILSEESGPRKKDPGPEDTDALMKDLLRRRAGGPADPALPKRPASPRAEEDGPSEPPKGSPLERIGPGKPGESRLAAAKQRLGEIRHELDGHRQDDTFAKNYDLEAGQAIFELIREREEIAQGLARDFGLSVDEVEAEAVREAQAPAGAEAEAEAATGADAASDAGAPPPDASAPAEAPIDSGPDAAPAELDWGGWLAPEDP